MVQNRCLTMLVIGKEEKLIEHPETVVSIENRG